MRIVVFGGDGFCGWPTSLHLSAQGHDVLIVDNLARRFTDVELEISSLTPIAPLSKRLEAWTETTGRAIAHLNFDVAKEYYRITNLFQEFRPDAVVHFAEQRAAPYSMKSERHKRYTVDDLRFISYNKNDGVRITDLHQGVVWGTNTKETKRDPRLVNRFDYDGDYGTVLNRFLMQAAIEYPLTVHGKGGQTRAFIHIQDTVRCIDLALQNPPGQGDRVQIFNQMTETHR